MEWANKIKKRTVEACPRSFSEWVAPGEPMSCVAVLRGLNSAGAKLAKKGQAPGEGPRAEREGSAGRQVRGCVMGVGDVDP